MEELASKTFSSIPPVENQLLPSIDLPSAFANWNPAGGNDNHNDFGCCDAMMMMDSSSSSSPADAHSSAVPSAAAEASFSSSSFHFDSIFEPHRCDCGVELSLDTACYHCGKFMLTRQFFRLCDNPTTCETCVFHVASSRPMSDEMGVFASSIGSDPLADLQSIGTTKTIVTVTPSSQPSPIRFLNFSSPQGAGNATTSLSSSSTESTTKKRRGRPPGVKNRPSIEIEMEKLRKQSEPKKRLGRPQSTDTPPEKRRRPSKSSSSTTTDDESSSSYSYMDSDTSYDSSPYNPSTYRQQQQTPIPPPVIPPYRSSTSSISTRSVELMDKLRALSDRGMAVVSSRKQQQVGTSLRPTRPQLAPIIQPESTLFPWKTVAPPPLFTIAQCKVVEVASASTTTTSTSSVMEETSVSPDSEIYALIPATVETFHNCSPSKKTTSPSTEITVESVTELLKPFVHEVVEKTIVTTVSSNMSRLSETLTLLMNPKNNNNCYSSNRFATDPPQHQQREEVREQVHRLEFQPGSQFVTAESHTLPIATPSSSDPEDTYMDNSKSMVLLESFNPLEKRGLSRFLAPKTVVSQMDEISEGARQTHRIFQTEIFHTHPVLPLSKSLVNATPRQPAQPPPALNSLRSTLDILAHHIDEIEKNSSTRGGSFGGECGKIEQHLLQRVRDCIPEHDDFDIPFAESTMMELDQIQHFEQVDVIERSNYSQSMQDPKKRERRVSFRTLESNASSSVILPVNSSESSFGKVFVEYVQWTPNSFCSTASSANLTSAGLEVSKYFQDPSALLSKGCRKCYEKFYANKSTLFEPRSSISSEDFSPPAPVKLKSENPAFGSLYKCIYPHCKEIYCFMHATEIHYQTNGKCLKHAEHFVPKVTFPSYLNHSKYLRGSTSQTYLGQSVPTSLCLPPPPPVPVSNPTASEIYRIKAWFQLQSKIRARRRKSVLWDKLVTRKIRLQNSAMPIFTTPKILRLLKREVIKSNSFRDETFVVRM